MPLPMTGPATDEPTDAKLSRVRPGVDFVPNDGLLYGTYSPEHQFLFLASYYLMTPGFSAD